jgi:glutamate dehydrogenase/leucine dehydrogenase
LVEGGVKVVAVSDITGGVHNPEGLDIPKLKDWAAEHDSVVGFPGATNISNKDLLELECDFLVPAAKENQITKDNAPDIKAKVIAEGANSPTTGEATKILDDKGVFIIPDILCNGGGVIVSWLEMSQSEQFKQFEEDEVNAELKKRMRKTFSKVLEFSQRGADMRTAAHMIAVQNVADAVMARGWEA